MGFNLQELIATRVKENVSLHDKHVNPQFAKVLRVIGFDRSYVRGEGSYLYDVEGKKYVDYLAGYGVYNIGRNHPVVRDALKQYLDCDHPSLVQIEAPLLSGILAEELKKRVPASLDTVYFTNSGTEAVESALKFARCATGKPTIVYCDHAFHGLTYGSLSVNGEGWFREGFEPLLPQCDAIPFNDLNALEDRLKKTDVAAFILEPIQGKGVYVATDDYLLKAKALCQRYGALFLLDEVQTGFGRTGKLFAREYSGVEPDILVMSKALSGGYVPVGAVMMRRDIYKEVFSSMDRCVVHSSTFGQGAFAMTAGLATLHVIDSEKLVANAAHTGDLLIKGLNEIRNQFEVVHDIRGRGLMIGIEFARPQSLKLKLGWDFANKLHRGLFTQAVVMSLFKDFGILTQVAGKGVDIIKLIPPLVLTPEDVAYFLASFTTVLERSQRFPGPIWDLTAQLTKQMLKR